MPKQFRDILKTVGISGMLMVLLLLAACGGSTATTQSTPSPTVIPSAAPTFIPTPSPTLTPSVTSLSLITPIPITSSSQTARCDQELGVNIIGPEFGTEYDPTLQDFLYYSKRGAKEARLTEEGSRLGIAKLKNEVTNAGKAGLAAIVTLQDWKTPGDLNPSVLNSLPRGTLTNLWHSIAQSVGSLPSLCGYDLANEPYNDGSRGWPLLANSLISSIRAVDKHHFIFIEEDGWNHSKEWNPQEARQFHDPVNRLVYSAHSYWNPNENEDFGSLPDFSTAEGWMQDSLSPFLDWCGSTHSRCAVNEFAVPLGNFFLGSLTQSQQQQYIQIWSSVLRNALVLMIANNIGGSYWAAYPPNNGDSISCAPDGGQDSAQVKAMWPIWLHQSA